MVTAFQTNSHVNRAPKLYFLLFTFIYNMFLKMIPSRVYMFIIKSPVHMLRRNKTSSKNFVFVGNHTAYYTQNEWLLKWFRSHKHQVLIPQRIDASTHRNSCP
ncbi:hypothetical protein CDL12_25178 [Handroanthus impetiginosus]|uniref:Uncharacterized protein n=1 Tax=Handroanthus impetiginosus TaxID=429701 RepID=A0A2G9GBF4_9LAMI|nr:hypothetical protein CDL12_25178 [Handroanthus impetiginosus]